MPVLSWFFDLFMVTSHYGEKQDEPISIVHFPLSVCKTYERVSHFLMYIVQICDSDFI